MENDSVRRRALRSALIQSALAALGSPHKLSSSEPLTVQSLLGDIAAVLPRGKASALVNVLAHLRGANLPDSGDLALDLRRMLLHADEAAGFASLSDDLERSSAFETWIGTIRRFALNVPAPSGEPGVSLFHEFKLTSALGHAALGNPNGLADGFTLVEGDFPGIQKMIYTVTSEKAAKSVRGRSFFLQLLTECVVMRLLAELGDLPSTSVLISAGSKFTVLAPASALNHLARLSAEINRGLLNVFYGDIHMTLMGEHVSAQEVVNGSARPRAAKPKQPFYSLIDPNAQLLDKAKTPLTDDERYALLFEPFGVGSKFACAVSRREPQDADERREAEIAIENGASWIAPENRAFIALAERLAEAQQIENDRDDAMYLVFTPTKPETGQDYADYLWQITGWSCSLERDSYVRRLPRDSRPRRVARLNSADFDPAYAQGFRFFALHTPLTMGSDVEWWEQYRHPECRHADQQSDGEHCPKRGDIRSFDLIASARAKGEFIRYGILRMDVDGLGSMFSTRMTITQRIAASDSLSLFFEGYLPRMCRGVEESTGRDNSLYLIYGGGDDLFVVGEWDLLPTLAETIRAEFGAYTQETLSISAGIILVPLHFPFYRGAELAGKALDGGAKRFRRPVPKDATEAEKEAAKKDAINFMGVTMGWRQHEAWERARVSQRELLKLESSLKTNSITNNVFRVYSRWQQDCDLSGKSDLRVGRFTWQAMYQIARLERDYPAHKQQIRDVMRFLLDHVELSGAVARWTEYERRANSTGGIHD